MNIKNLIGSLAIVGLIMISFQLNAQEQSEDKRAKIEALRHEYINERLELSEEQEAEMKKIQEEYQAKMKAMRQEHEQVSREMKAEMQERRKEEKELTEEEAREMLMNRLEREESKIKMEKEYTEAMIKAISAKKTVDYKRLEREFKRELLQMLRDDKERHRMREELRRGKMQEGEAKPMPIED